MENVMTTNIGLLEGSQSDAPPASARREETAVYVGRASFRMTRPAYVATDNATEAGPAVAALPVVGLAGETEEHVVLSPPAVTVMVAESDDTGALADVPRIENDGPSAAVLVPTEIRSVSRRSPMWLVAAALVVGAFGTLSAQAVMR